MQKCYSAGVYILGGGKREPETANIGQVRRLSALYKQKNKIRVGGRGEGGTSRLLFKIGWSV